MDQDKATPLTILIIDDASKQEIALRPGDRLLIGREPPARNTRERTDEDAMSPAVRQYRSRSPDVSEKHAELRVTQDRRVLIKDLSSTNGIFARLPPRQDFELEPNTEVLLGTSLVVQLRTPLWDSVDGPGHYESPVDFAAHVQTQLQEFGATAQIISNNPIELRRLRGTYTRLPLPAYQSYIVVRWKGSINRAFERWLALRVLMFNSRSLCIPLGSLDKVEWQFTAASGPRQGVLKAARRIAPTDGTVLLCGPTGVGKDVAARDIHNHSARANGPYLAFNCAAIPGGIAESVLFGTDAGAFTGAKTCPGLFEQADGGTLFLDEIGELPLDLQAKLLRVLEDKRIRRVGGLVERAVNVRIIAATNRSLPQMVTQGKFRQDLWYRLEGVQLNIPDLQEEDILAMVPAFYEEGLREQNLSPLCEDEVETLGLLAIRQEWEGNARQLRNALRRYLVYRDPALSVEENWQTAMYVNTDAQAPANQAAASSPELPAGAVQDDEADLPEDLISTVAKLNKLLTLLIFRPLLLQDRHWGVWTQLGKRLGMTGAGAQERIRRLNLPTNQPIDIAAVDQKIQEARNELQPYLGVLRRILKL